MDTPQYDAEQSIAEVAAATGIALVLGLLLWPPGAVYWTGVAAVVGEGPTLFFVAALAVGFGAWVGRTSGLALRHLAVGGLLAYLGSMAAIAVVLQPDSPVHLLFYGALLGCFLGGASAWLLLARYRRRSADR